MCFWQGSRISSSHQALEIPMIFGVEEIRLTSLLGIESPQILMIYYMVLDLPGGYDLEDHPRISD